MLLLLVALNSYAASGVGLNLGYLLARSEFQSVSDFTRHVLTTVSAVPTTAAVPCFTNLLTGEVSNVSMCATPAFPRGVVTPAFFGANSPMVPDNMSSLLGYGTVATSSLLSNVDVITFTSLFSVTDFFTFKGRKDYELRNFFLGK